MLALVRCAHWCVVSFIKGHLVSYRHCTKVPAKKAGAHLTKPHLSSMCVVRSVHSLCKRLLKPFSMRSVEIRKLSDDHLLTTTLLFGHKYLFLIKQNSNKTIFEKIDNTKLVLSKLVIPELA